MSTYFYFYKLSVNLNVKVRESGVNVSGFWISILRVWQCDLKVMLQMWFSSACSLVTDNDSDDSVNGGSPKPPPNRQHQKEKKEFPVSLEISHNILRCIIYFRRDSHTYHLMLRRVLGWKCHLWSKSLYFIFGVSPTSWLTLHWNLKYDAFPLSDPNT